MARQPTREQMVDALIQSLQETGEGLNRMGQHMAETSGTHPTDMTALSVLSRHSGTPLTVGELGEQLGLSKAAASSLADRLERAGHAQRVRDPQDRRRWNVELTASAHTHAEQALGQFLERLRSALGNYTADELAVAERVLGDVRAATSGPSGAMNRNCAGGDRPPEQAPGTT